MQPTIGTLDVREASNSDRHQPRVQTQTPRVIRLLREFIRRVRFRVCFVRFDSAFCAFWLGVASPARRRQKAKAPKVSTAVTLSGPSARTAQRGTDPYLLSIRNNWTKWKNSPSPTLCSYAIKQTLLTGNDTIDSKINGIIAVTLDFLSKDVVQNIANEHKVGYVLFLQLV